MSVMGLAGRSREWRIGWAFALPGLLLLAIVMGFPLVYACILSISSMTLIKPSLTPLVGFKNFGQDIDGFPHLKRWFEKSVGERPAVVRGKAVGADLRKTPGINTEEQRKILFGQTAQVVR